MSFDDDGCDGTNGLASTITGTLGSGTYYLIVDGWGTTSSGDFTLTASASATTRLPGGFSDSVTDQEKLDIWDMTGSGITVLSEYTPGIEQTLDFNLNVTSADNEWADGFYLTFPQGWTLSSGTNTQGQPVSVSDNVITFGNPDAASGLGPWGIGDHPFTVTLTPAAAGGNVVVTYYIGGDQWASANPPYFVEGSFTLVQYVPQAGDLMGYNVYMNDTQHNTNLIGTLSYTVGGLTNNTEYTLGVTAAYYVSDTENQESSPVTISGTPTYI